MLTFNHFNFNVSDLDRSLAFYKEALDLEPVGERKVADDGSFIIVYLQVSAGASMLTWLSMRTTTRPLMPGTPPWAASALKIPPWGSIL